MKNIYQLALGCKKISDERIGTDRNLIRYQNILFTDYTVKGNVDEYLAAIDDLRFALVDKYPNVAYELRLHKEKFGDEKIIHFTALSTIVDCVLALEEKSNAKKIFISHSSKDKTIMEKFSDYILQLGIGLSNEDIFCTSIEDGMIYTMVNATLKDGSVVSILYINDPITLQYVAASVNSDTETILYSFIY